MALHIKQGDTVIVTSGNLYAQHKDNPDRRTGKVLRVDPKQDRVWVEGVNVRHKHVRPSQQNPQGGRIEKEMSIHISNVSPTVRVDGKAVPTRVRFETRKDGSKVRIAVKTGEVLSELKKAKKG